MPTVVTQNGYIISLSSYPLLYKHYRGLYIVFQQVYILMTQLTLNFECPVCSGLKFFDDSEFW